LRDKWIRTSTSFIPPGQLAAPDEVSVVVAKLNAKQHTALALNSTSTCSEFCKCMGQASCQKPMKQTIPESDDSDDEEYRMHPYLTLAILCMAKQE